MTEPVVVTTGEREVAAAHAEARPSASTACWAASSGSALQITNRDQVAVSDCAHVGVMQANECLCLAGSQNKLDLKTIGRMQFNNGSKIAATQAMLGQVSIQDDSVEQVEHVYPGCAVTK